MYSRVQKPRPGAALTSPVDNATPQLLAIPLLAGRIAIAEKKFVSQLNDELGNDEFSFALRCHDAFEPPKIPSLRASYALLCAAIHCTSFLVDVTLEQ